MMELTQPWELACSFRSNEFFQRLTNFSPRALNLVKIFPSSLGIAKQAVRPPKLTHQRSRGAKVEKSLPGIFEFKYFMNFFQTKNITHQKRSLRRQHRSKATSHGARSEQRRSQFSREDLGCENVKGVEGCCDRKLSNQIQG